MEREHLPLAAALDLAVTPWGVLESGELTGKGCLDFWLIQAQLDHLAAASAFRPGSPRSFLESDHVRGLILGETFDRIAGHRRAG